MSKLPIAIYGLLLLAAATPARAQHESAAEYARFRADCRHASQVLERSEPHTKRRWALDTILPCREEAPLAFTQQWRTMSADSQAVQEIVTASTEVRDQRVYEAALAAAADRTRPDVVRVGAMVVLTNYLAPHYALSLGSVTAPTQRRPRYPAVSAIQIDQARLEGPVPLEPGNGARSLALLQRVEVEEPGNWPVWYAAHVLGQTVAAYLANEHEQ